MYEIWLSLYAYIYADLMTQQSGLYVCVYKWTAVPEWHLELIVSSLQQFIDTIPRLYNQIIIVPLFYTII